MIKQNNCRDYIPKLCQKEMITAIEEFIEEKLCYQIQNLKLEKKNLVDSDPKEEERKTLALRKALLEETLEAMDDVLGSTDFKV